MTHLEKLERTGIERVGSPKAGFRFPRASPEQLQRALALKIPPAWTDVRVSPSAGARLQAIGRDGAGRWQYLYSDAAIRERERKKHARLLAFADALPRLRRAIDQGLSTPGLRRERVMACVLRILAGCFMRPGSEVYAKENGSFGIATLQARHATVQGDTVTFDYIGKAGKRQLRSLRDRRVARTVRELKRLPGKQLFRWLADDGALVKVTRQAINDELRRAMGRRFSAKDFRTWAGTLVCANVLARLHGEGVPGKTDRRRMIAAAVKETAAQLGNTPAVCKASYIWPAVLSSYYRGQVLAPFFATAEELLAAQGTKLRRCEAALVSLLAQAPRVEPVALAKKRARRGRERLRKQAQAAAAQRVGVRKLARLSRAFGASDGGSPQLRQAGR